MANSIRDRSVNLASRLVGRTRRFGKARLSEKGGISLVAQVTRLQSRVTELEAEVQENRQLNVRLAELTDVVQELLLPVALHDEESLAAKLQRHATSL